MSSGGTLVAVVVGALIGGFLSYLPELRRERRAERAAKRLVHYELRSAYNTLRETQEEVPSKEQFSKYRENVMPTDAWREYRPLLAGTLRNDDEWLGVILAFRAIEAEKINLLHATPTGDDLQALEKTIKVIAEALEGFEKVAQRRTLRHPFGGGGKLASRTPS